MWVFSDLGRVYFDRCVWKPWIDWKKIRQSGESFDILFFFA